MTDTSRSSGASSTGPAAPAKSAKRSKPVDLRTVHRAISVVALLFMLWIGVTGSAIQLFDLSALLRNAPESDPVMQSLNEGKFGNPPYAIVLRSDWSADALPAGLDKARAFNTVVAALHRQLPGKQPSFVELRMDSGRPIGQAGFPDPRPAPGRRGPSFKLYAYDALSGAAVAPMDSSLAVPVRSWRQELKELHRFWGLAWGSRRDVPGVWIELMSGLALWTLMITGLITYVRLLRQRRRMKRGQVFWLSGGTLRGLHRSVAISAAIILMFIAGSGTWIGFESVWNTLQAHHSEGDLIPLTDAEIRSEVAATLAILQREQPGIAMRVLRVRNFSGVREGVVVTREKVTRQLVFETQTGKSMRLTEPEYPRQHFIFGVETHENVKHFHMGLTLGIWARVLSLLGGLALVFLAGSGLTLYCQMWNKRRSAGRRAFVWK